MTRIVLSSVISNVGMGPLDFFNVEGLLEFDFLNFVPALLRPLRHVRLLRLPRICTLPAGPGKLFPVLANIRPGFEISCSSSFIISSIGSAFG